MQEILQIINDLWFNIVIDLVVGFIYTIIAGGILLYVGYKFINEKIEIQDQKHKLIEIRYNLSI